MLDAVDAMFMLVLLMDDLGHSWLGWPAFFLLDEKEALPALTDLKSELN